MFEFHKAEVPEESEDKTQFVENLMKFGVSIKQYLSAYAMDDVTMYVCEEYVQCHVFIQFSLL